MKLLKLGAVLGVLICGLLGILMTLGLVQDAEAFETMKKALIIVGIVTVCLATISLISSKPKN